ncbi:MAG: phosphoribosylformylglycinamidine cyclo-ligase [Bacteroidetes bacterium]|nr:phosphoribosylformylglycinamidine cyclo-ligase [Bacteroidota bacterium]MCL5737364.1 phosphoribosylformylglycinamidine cyclo-ligase [Bacteroidota bacterium]
MTTYKQSGVNIDEADKLIKRIKPLAKQTFNKNVLSEIGFFGGFFNGKFPGYRNPVLVSSVDGVGTKVKVAIEMGKHDTIGQDLVNHCVNDIGVGGAKPLFFLDYFACGKLNADIAEQVIKGFSLACKENGVALIGGETAEMPGVYSENDYDLAGTIVGVVDRAKIINGSKVKKGNVLVGIASTGLHTNGYSLARKTLLSKYRVDSYVDELGETVGEALLRTHRSYLQVMEYAAEKFSVHGMVHITGGGIEGNTVRVIREPRKFKVLWGNWEVPPIFGLIQSLGGVPEADMRKTFNLGVGLILIVSANEVDRLISYLKKRGETCFIVGEVTG